MMKRISYYLASLSVFLVGCSSSSDSTAVQFPWTIPGVNSMYIYHVREFDASGFPVVDEYDTSLVIASGFESEGKADCVETQKNPNSFLPPVYGMASYGSNGDWSIYGSGGLPGHKGGWETFHLGSKAASSALYYDSTYLSNGQIIHASLTDSNFYAGEDTVIEAGASVEAFKFTFLRFDQNRQVQFSGTEWIAPSIGINVRVVDTFARPGNYGIVRTQNDLVSFKLY